MDRCRASVPSLLPFSIPLALLLASLLFVSSVPRPAGAQTATPSSRVSFLDYHTMTEWLPGTPGTAAGAVGGFINPAVWSTLSGSLQESALWWNDRSARRDALDNWGFALTGPLGFGANSQVFELGAETYRVTDWQLGLSGGDRRRRFGLAYRWPTGDDQRLGWQKTLVAGWLLRPSPYLSLGAVGIKSVESPSRQGLLDLGLRPFGTDRLVLHGDFSLSHRDKLEDGRWGAGLTWQPVRGIHLGLTARDVDGADDLRWIARVGITGERLGLDWLGGKTGSDDLDRSSFLVRINPSAERLTRVPGLPHVSQTYYAPVNLENRYLTYQKYRYFDTTRVAWLDLMRYLDAAAADPYCAGLVLNLSDFRGRASLVWELRRKLEAMQADGKEIVALVNRLDMLGYYLASVADHLIMETEGSLLLPGIASGRTYFQGMVEKLGLGYQELRYFTYKSAAEGGSRMDMSEAEREQRDRLVEVIYGEIRRGVCVARGLTAQQFDDLVDEQVYLMPARAQELGLIDAQGSREQLKRWAGQQRQAGQRAPYRGFFPGGLPERQWGQPDRIAVVYAVGECAMDSGIKGRQTSRYLHGLARDHSVKAVVLRVDSPGGDPLPSEMIAAAVRRLNEAGIPVIVSQGDVAGSGGYWLSMDGHEVLTTPLTITGSIGVISVWIWARELADKLGLAYSGVQRGKYADLLRTLNVPFLGIQVPHRGLDESELEIFRTIILEAYAGFVARVATGRDLTEARVRELGEGRIWMGEDAVSHRLCDKIGGLTEAIAAARTAGGVHPDREVELLEYPPRPVDRSVGPAGRRRTAVAVPTGPGGRISALGRAGRPAAGSPGGGLRRLATEPFDYAAWYLRTVARDMGKPQAVLPPEVLPVRLGRAGLGMV
jgi:protease IV